MTIIFFVRNWKSKFLKALKEDPEFAAEVRALLLSEDLLNLPPKFDRMEKKIDRNRTQGRQIRRKANKIRRKTG
jgi:hypothetical protein